MPRIIINSRRTLSAGRYLKTVSDEFSSDTDEKSKPLPRKAKLLAWAIFLMLFIENGTLGLLPENYYFVYRNVRISDLILYGLIVYSLFCIKEYYELFNSRSLVLIKVLFFYIILVFIGSAFVYDYNVIEFFFRLKLLWESFMIFPFMLLIKRNALLHLVKIIFPFTILANVLYILTSLTGTAYLPDVTVVKQTLPGGFKIYRVYGGTFFGDVYFLGYIYFWITKKFRLRQLFIVILLILPHILAFGRYAWVFFIFTITTIFIWNAFKNKNFKTVFRQIVLATLLLVTIFFVFTKFIPESSELTGAIGSRIEQGQEDYKYKEGTYGSRLENAAIIVNHWMNTNILFGVGMHPFWVVKPVTQAEYIYYWGLSDTTWVGTLLAYGLIGVLLVALIQINYGVVTFKILKNTGKKDIYILFIILFFTTILFSTFTYSILIFGLWGPSFTLSFYIAVVAFKYEHLNQ